MSNKSLSAVSTVLGEQNFFFGPMLPVRKQCGYGDLQ